MRSQETSQRCTGRTSAHYQQIGVNIVLLRHGETCFRNLRALCPFGLG